MKGYMFTKLRPSLTFSRSAKNYRVNPQFQKNTLDRIQLFPLAL